MLEKIENISRPIHLITQINGKHSNMLTTFGLINLEKDETYSISDAEHETALLLMSGSVNFSWNSNTKNVTRSSLFDEGPSVLHVSAMTDISITAQSSCEIAFQQVKNKNFFESIFYEPDDVRTQYFGKDTLQNTSTRTVRTVFDADNAPYSNMVLGEVVNYPGKWSSYPPHNHPQPEIYHYRFLPEHGFGFGQVGDKAYPLSHKSTLMIEPWVVHPQTSAPGYAMYYIWMIPHLPDAKFGPESREFIEEHKWLLNEDANIWSAEE